MPMPAEYTDSIVDLGVLSLDFFTGTGKDIYSLPVVDVSMYGANAAWPEFTSLRSYGGGWKDQPAQVVDADACLGGDCSESRPDFGIVYP